MKGPFVRVRKVKGQWWVFLESLLGWTPMLRFQTWAEALEWALFVAAEV